MVYKNMEHWTVQYFNISVWTVKQVKQTCIKGMWPQKENTTPCQGQLPPLSTRFALPFAPAQFLYKWSSSAHDVIFLPRPSLVYFGCRKCPIWRLVPQRECPEISWKECLFHWGGSTRHHRDTRVDEVPAKCTVIKLINESDFLNKKTYFFFKVTFLWWSSNTANTYIFFLPDASIRAPFYLLDHVTVC